MRLKSVRIFGFKTFADRTEFSVDGGIIAVVGPNGCGKSNLVDAILWALGESNARQLRASASQDVIFSGSARRKPVGFAEVTLLFDNEDGSLPVDTPEVAVTRRLTRGGDSDYFINRRSCRQRDIHELLADSGLGRAGYAIVSQKEIDQALAASPEDRRAWVDEAAGVQRYRTRKAESVKRMASAKEHLDRVEDILRELESQREPLRAESEVATKFKIAASALREVETGLLIQDLAKAVTEISELETRLSKSLTLVWEENGRAERLDLEGEGVREKVGELEHRIEGVRARLQETITSIERSGAGARLGEERLRSLDEMEATLKSGDTRDLVIEAQAELEACHLELAAEEEYRLRCRTDLGGVDEEARAVAERLKVIEAALGKAREQHALRLKQEAELQHRQARRATAVRELEGIDADLPSLEEAREAASQEAAEALRLFSEAEGDLRRCEHDLAELRANEDALSIGTRELMGEKASLEGRKRGIEATIQAHEGLAQGSRAVIEAAERGELTGSYLPVGAAIRTDKEFALAIETALGAAVNDLIVPHEGDAKSAIQYLRERRLGRATFQPVPLMHPSEPNAEFRRVLERPHVLGQASRLVQCDKSHRPVIESLLGRVMIVRDLDAALGLAKTNGWSRLVTLDGEVVHSSGAVSGGQTGKPQYGLVQRKADLDQIERQIERLEKDLQKSQADAETAASTRQNLLVEVAGLKTELDSRRQALNDAKDYVHTLNAELHAAARSKDKLAKELEELAAEVALVEEVDIQQLQAHRDALINELANRSADANQVKERLRDAEHRVQQAAHRVASSQKRLHTAEHAESHRAARLENLAPERDRIRREIVQHGEEAAQAELKRKHGEADLREMQAEKDGLLREGLRISDEAKEARANVAAIGEANHQAELARARAESRRATAAERLLEEYGVSEDEAIVQAPGIVVPADAQPLANRLRREIRAMGPVNVGAIEAYDRLTTRFDELSAQKADILEGIEQVEAGMHELDKLTRERFQDTFLKVQAAYTVMFQKLFGGGEGRIYLDNPGSILESGIEIEVTLPGKKRQRLELLSGGERALCATGFLFALLDVKPSPLVVLDEVDAPLDGRNVERFGDVLQEFTDRTQFIVITHNPTTIERAPVWLGVTMQEPGVSTLVPARLPTQAVVEAEIPARRTDAVVAALGSPA